jgi:Ca2+-binding EF-hand superfamily protein
MNVGELIEVLKKLPKTLDIRLVEEGGNDEANIWLSEVEVSKKGESGYEEFGEVRLVGSE